MLWVSTSSGEANWHTRVFCFKMTKKNREIIAAIEKIIIERNCRNKIVVIWQEKSYPFGDNNGKKGGSERRSGSGKNRPVRKGLPRGHSVAVNRDRKLARRQHDRARSDPNFPTSHLAKKWRNFETKNRATLPDPGCLVCGNKTPKNRTKPARKLKELNKSEKLTISTNIFSVSRTNSRLSSVPRWTLDSRGTNRCPINFNYPRNMPEDLKFFTKIHDNFDNFSSYGKKWIKIGLDLTAVLNPNARTFRTES